jgi:hypothetical protein
LFKSRQQQSVVFFLIFLIELFDNDYSKNWKAIILKKEAKLYFLHKQKKALNLWSFL